MKLDEVRKILSQFFDAGGLNEWVLNVERIWMQFATTSKNIYIIYMHLFIRKKFYILL